MHAQNKGFPGGSDGKELACNMGHPGSIPGLGRSSGEGNDYPCLENSKDREVWGHKESDMPECLICTENHSTGQEGNQFSPHPYIQPT